MTWQAGWLRNFTNVESSFKILEIGAGNFETSKYLAENYSDKNFFAIDFVFSKHALQTFSNTPRNLTIVKHDARDLSLFQDGYFDMIFSVAVLEHIHELKIHLDEIYRVLRKGGHYVFYESPFWSSSLGHHYLHWKEDCPIPHYGHLYLDKENMENLMKKQNINSNTTRHIMERVYSRDDLSRLSYTKTKKIIESTNFEISKWQTVPDQNYDITYEKRIEENNIYDLNLEDLKIKGIEVILTK